MLQILRKRRPKKLKKKESLRKKNHLEKSKSCRTRRMKIIDTDAKHTPHYGSDDEENDEEAKEDDPVVNVHKKASSQCVTSNKKCKCGSTEHRYTSYHKSPLNKKKQPCI